MIDEQSENFFALAESWSKKATCPRASVGCVIISHRRIFVAGGYNGSPESLDTCLTEGCITEGGHCVRAVHAEIRAIAYAARRGLNLDRSEAFITLLPCIQCMQALLLSGIRVIHYDLSYDRPERDHLHQLARSAGVQLIQRREE